MRVVSTLLSAFFILPGCALAVAAVVAPVMAINQAGDVKQGFTVVDRSGNRIAGPSLEDAGKDRVIQLSGREAVCTGTYKHETFFNSDFLQLSISLNCTGGRSATGYFNYAPTGFTDFNFSYPGSGNWCSAPFKPKGGSAVTFTAPCKKKQTPVPNWNVIVSVYPQSDGLMKMTVFVPPKPA